MIYIISLAEKKLFYVAMFLFRNIARSVLFGLDIGINFDGL